MTVQRLKEALSLKLLAGEEGLSQEVSGCYIGDLLSWVMGRAKAGDAWLTVMGNISAPGGGVPGGYRLHYPDGKRLAGRGR